MSYRAYATEKEICNALCKYKIGDNVTLLRRCQSDTGIFEAGTEMCVTDIKIRENICLNKVYFDELNNYTADNEIFSYELTIPDSEIQLSCNGDKLNKSTFRLKESFLVYQLAFIFLSICAIISKTLEGYIICGALLIFGFAFFLKTGIRDKPNIRRKITTKKIKGK